MFLEIQGIRKSFGEGDNKVEVLKGIDLGIEKGGCSTSSAALTAQTRGISASAASGWQICQSAS